MAGYATVTMNEPKEEEEENVEGNCKQPERNPVGGSHVWEKEIVARACSERAGNLARYTTGMANEPEEDEEEEYTAGNCKQPERNPVGVSHGWGNEIAPTSAPITMGVTGGATGRFTKQAIMLPTEGNTPLARTK